VVESLRQNGILLGQITPQGGTISGSSSVVQFDAWNWEDAAVKTDDGIHLSWPSTLRRGRWWVGEPRGYQPNKNYLEQWSGIIEFLEAAKAYNAVPAKTIHLPYAATKGLFDGSQRLYVTADGEREIFDAVTELERIGIKHIVIVGGYFAEKQLDLLKSKSIPVLVHNPHELPNLDDDAYDFVYGLAARLHKAGLLVGIQNASKANFQVRNLPFYAGHSVGYGISKEEALALISSNTAKILGIDDTYGTLESGKSATLFISEGDALDMRTNQLSHAFIDGREISLETHQTELWKRYQEKYSRQD
jgi:cytosine/adenosine deaminase-related metal-dependent hydrolase